MDIQNISPLNNWSNPIGAPIESQAILHQPLCLSGAYQSVRRWPCDWTHHLLTRKLIPPALNNPTKSVDYMQLTGIAGIFYTQLFIFQEWDVVVFVWWVVLGSMYIVADPLESAVLIDY